MAVLYIGLAVSPDVLKIRFHEMLRKTKGHERSSLKVPELVEQKPSPSLQLIDSPKKQLKPAKAL